MKIKIYQLPWLIILAGILFSLYLVWLVPDGVYFSGDGGLKALLAQQFSSGEFRFDLVPPPEAWIRQLWQEGLYPYEEPFVYYIGGRYYITFPFVFSLVTSPFYALFGYRGFYVIPLVSTWVIWLTSYWACQKLKFNSLRTSIALLVIIFASNLTLYSAMYWEHTLAVALCLAGMVLLLIPGETTKLSIKTAIASGFLLGLSAWVRSEFLAAIATLAFLVYLAYLIDKLNGKFIFKGINSDYLHYLSTNKEIFVVSMAVTVGLFFVCNQLAYNHFLGIHALQIVEGFSLSRRLSEAWASFQELSVVFFSYFPVAAFPLLYLLLYILQKFRAKFGYQATRNFLLILSALVIMYFLIAGGWTGLETVIRQWFFSLLILIVWLSLLRKIEVKLDAQSAIIYLMCLLFTIGVSLLVDTGADEIAVGGKQWGPRYLLILIPFTTFLAIQQMKYLAEKSLPLARYLSLGTMSLLLVLGIYKNLYLGTKFFYKNHQGVTRAIEALRENPDKIVVVSEQYAAQVLGFSLRDEKIFFMAKNSQNLVKLGTVLLEQKQSKFIYICYPYAPCNPPKDNPDNLKFIQGDRRFQIELSELGKQGKYTVYEGSIVEKSLLDN